MFPTPSADWRRPAVAAAVVSGLTFGVCGLWSVMAEIDSAVVASGNVAVESDRKAVQHLEGGVVSQILVTEDARVHEGQVVVRIDPVSARAQADMARFAVASGIAEEARLVAETTGAERMPDVRFPADLADEATLTRVVADHTKQFRERRAARAMEVSILAEKIRQLATQGEGAQAQVKATRQQIASITTEYDNLKPLADRGLVPVTRVTTLDRSRVDLVGRVGSLESEISRLALAAQETRLQVAQVDRRVVEEASGKLTEVRARVADATEKLRVASDVLRRSEVRAPRAGRVVGLKVHTVGAVARPGETLMEIVPEDDLLMVTAHMSPTDVNNVHPGMTAEVRLPSFKARTTPLAIGEVRSVSADVQRDEVTRQPYYELRVSVHASSFPEAVRSKLRPGMPADVMVATGERTVLAYLVQPLGDAMRHGMREN